MKPEKLLIKKKQEPNPLKAVEDSSFEKGRKFEAFVANLFNKKSGRFEIINLDSPSAVLYGKAAGTLFPDFKFLFYTKTAKYKFAVECKWRKHFINGKIKWAEDDFQINNYLTYGQQNHLPVFIVIGIGGTPSNPEKLFVTPISQIATKPEVYEKELLTYKRNPNQRFFYDVKQLKLF